MNTAPWCPPLFAVDDVFDFTDADAPPPRPCTLSVPAYLVWYALLVVGSILTALAQWSRWRALHSAAASGPASVRARTNARGSRRAALLSASPWLTSAAHAVVLLAHFVLTATNVATTQNGASLALVSMVPILWAATAQLTLAKWRRLAARNAVLMHARPNLNSNSNSLANKDASVTALKSSAPGPDVENDRNMNNNSERDVQREWLARLEQADGVHRAYAVVQSATLATMVVLSVPVNLARPELSDVWARTLIGLTGMVVAAQNIVLALHIRRCLAVARTIGAGLAVADRAALDAQVRRALASMRRLQLTLALLATVFTALAALVAAGVIPLTWITMLIMITGDVVSRSYTAYAHRRRTRAKKAAVSSPKVSSGGGAEHAQGGGAAVGTAPSASLSRAPAGHGAAASASASASRRDVQRDGVGGGAGGVISTLAE